MATSNASGFQPVKMEVDYSASGIPDVPIKIGPDSTDASPAALSEDDIYEDAGDLDFTEANNQIILLKVPHFVWEQWSSIPEGESVPLGTIKQFVHKKDPKNQKWELKLSATTEHNKDLPRKYEIPIQNMSVTNTFVFSEKDLEGFRPNGRTKPKFGSQQSGPKPVGLPGQAQYPKGGQGPRSRFKRAIPKKTAFAGSAVRETNCLPIEDDDYARIMDKREALLAPKRKQTRFDPTFNPHGGNLYNPGTIGETSGFGTFIKTGAPARGKRQEHKAARMAQDELLDRIFECFERFSYWPFRAMKAELNQPEAFLKDNLEMVAELVRSGPFANKWTLKPEYKKDKYAMVKNEIAPDLADGGSDMEEDGANATGADDDDDDIALEDVMPT